MLDVMGALLSLVQQSTSVTDILAESGSDPEDRVFVNAIPQSVIEAADVYHPPKMVVLRQAGGQAKFDTLAIDHPAIDVLCYGETDKEADRVRRAVMQRFTFLKHEEHAGVCILDINATGGAFPLVDPDIEWPAVSQSFTVMAHVLEAA